MTPVASMQATAVPVKGMAAGDLQMMATAKGVMATKASRVPSQKTARCPS